MFSEIYKEVRKFLRGPIINHHNTPVPPLIKEMINRLYDTELGSDAFMVNSDDRTRYYISYPSDEKGSYDFRVVTTYLMGQETCIIMVPRIVEELYAAALDVFMDNVFVILSHTLSNVDMRVSHNTSLERIKIIALPIMFCTLLKNVLEEDMISNEELYKAYNSRIEQIVVKHAQENDTNENLNVCRFINKEFFEKAMVLLTQFAESNKYQNDLFNEFIFKYLDNSFILVEKEIIEAYNEPVKKKEWGE